MKKLNGFLFFFQISCIYSFTQEPDRCKDIIPLGFYERTNTTNTGNFTNDVKNWLLSDNLKEYMKKSGSGFSLGIPIEGSPLNIGFNSSDAEYNKMRNYLNSGGTNYINSSFANYVAQQVVNKSVVEAWSKCMTDYAPKTGLQASFEGEKNGDYFNLLIYWVPRLNVNNCKLTKPFVYGAEYDTTLFRTEIVVGTEPIRIPLIRKGNSTIFVTINSVGGLGSVSINIPKEEPRQVIIDHECDCYKGDIDACKKYREQIVENCKNISEWECTTLKGAINNLIQYMTMVSNYKETPQFDAILKQDKILGLFKKCN